MSAGACARQSFSPICDPCVGEVPGRVRSARTCGQVHWPCVVGCQGETCTSVAAAVTPAGAEGGQQVQLKLRAQAPQKWSAENPSLYTLCLELRRDEKLLHAEVWGTDRAGLE